MDKNAWASEHSAGREGDKCTAPKASRLFGCAGSVTVPQSFSCIARARLGGDVNIKFTVWLRNEWLWRGCRGDVVCGRWPAYTIWNFQVIQSPKLSCDLVEFCATRTLSSAARSTLSRVSTSIPPSLMLVSKSIARICSVERLLLLVVFHKLKLPSTLMLTVSWTSLPPTGRLASQAASPSLMTRVISPRRRLTTW